MKNSRLWQDLQRFDFDCGAQFSFSKRLARDNGWDLEFAARVIEEYRRFLYLACEANHPITPSDEVDQAWHLHLTYSRSYWDELCAQVLKRPLHHGPTRGGKAEGEKFENWYAKTLESYRETFGEPPREIWPPSEIRFGQAAHFRRVNTQKVWVLARPNLPCGAKIHWRLPQLGNARKLAPLLLALFLAGCAEVQSVGPNVFDWHGGPFLIFFWILSALGLAYGIWRKEADRLPVDTAFPTEPLDAYHVARLRDAKNDKAKDGATDVALAVLYRKGALEVTPAGTLRATGHNVSLSSFESAVLAQLNAAALVPGEESVRSLRLLLRSEIARFDQKLRDLGLLMSRETQQKIDNWPLGITFGLLLIGAIKIAVGLSRGRPVGFLFLSCAILIGFLVYFLSQSSRRSKRGDAYLSHLKQRQFEPQGMPNDHLDAIALHFALAGIMAFPPEIQRAMRPPSSSSGGGGSGCSSSFGGDSSGDSGGDSGGSDGGNSGCGGCGGGGD